MMTLTLPEVVPFVLDYDDLVSMHNDVRGMEDYGLSYYRAFVRDLLDAGYTVIDIAEMKGKVHSILLDLESIIVLDHEISDEKTSQWGRR